MALETKELEVVIGENQRPAFALALVVARLLAYDSRRLAINKLIEKTRLIANSVIATGDITLSISLFLGVEVESAPISEDQAQTILPDTEAILAALKEVSQDATGRALMANVVQALAKARRST